MKFRISFFFRWWNDKRGGCGKMWTYIQKIYLQVKSWYFIVDCLNVSFRISMAKGLCIINVFFLKYMTFGIDFFCLSLSKFYSFSLMLAVGVWGCMCGCLANIMVWSFVRELLAICFILYVCLCNPFIAIFFYLKRKFIFAVFLTWLYSLSRYMQVHTPR